MHERYELVGKLVFQPETGDSVSVGYRMLDRTLDELYDFTNDEVAVLRSQNDILTRGNRIEIIKLHEENDSLVSDYESQMGIRIPAGSTSLPAQYYFVGNMLRDIERLRAAGYETNYQPGMEADTQAIISCSKAEIEVQFNVAELRYGVVKDIVSIWNKNTRIETPAEISEESIMNNLHKCASCKCIADKEFKNGFEIHCAKCHSLGLDKVGSETK